MNEHDYVTATIALRRRLFDEDISLETIKALTELYPRSASLIANDMECSTPELFEKIENGLRPREKMGLYKAVHDIADKLYMPGRLNDGTTFSL
jgi:hypothetical protein